MLLIKMATPLIYQIKSLNQWNKNTISPGPVGSVGDVLTSVRVNQSAPDLPILFDKTFNPSNDVLRGSNVQDGRWYSFSDGGYNAIVENRKIDNIESVGWVKQNIVPIDRYTESIMLDQPAQGFKSQAAEILQKQGDMFVNLPGGYSPQTSSVLRGSQFPSSKYSF